MRPAMAAPSEGVNGSGVQVLTAARTLATTFCLKPGSVGAREYIQHAARRWERRCLKN